MAALRAVAHRPEHRGILLFLDITAAFPSVAHYWLFMVVEALGASSGLLNFLRASYVANWIYVQTDGVPSLAFLVMSGVLQGCPLSGSLFAMAFT
eukprot:4286062-Alexandrium_andersonii.AAC.1